VAVENYFSRSCHLIHVPPQIDHERLLLTLAILAVLVMAYSLVILQQILLGFFVVLALGMVYLFFVLLQLLDRIATALEAIADQRRE
jgi:cell division protein FtsL